jgi:hypothetical protein
MKDQLDISRHSENAAHREAAKEKATRPSGAAGCSAIPDVLFDGFAVYSELKDREKTYTTPENVSAVLDAVVRLLRQNAKCAATGSERSENE